MSTADNASYEGIPSLSNITLDDIANGLDAGRFTSVDLVRAYTTRINEVNNHFRAVLEINPDAEKIASELDEELVSKRRRGALHGVPILIKDNLCTLDKLNTTAGSYVLLGAKAPREARVVTKLREAGAVILGTTNLSEWANIRSSNSSSGWSPRGGQCLGVFCENMNPSGSSSGSGVASVLGLALACIGTETSGSICSPSQQNNIVGLKPTVGLVSRDCSIPISSRMDTIGPMARTVKDAACILQATAGKCEFDKRTQSIPFDEIPNYPALSCCSKRLDGIRIGVPENTFIDKCRRWVVDAFKQELEVLMGVGATVFYDSEVGFTGKKEYKEPLDKKERIESMLVDLKSEMKTFLGSLTENPNNLQNLAQVIEWTKTHSEEKFPDRDVKMFEMSEEIPAPTPEEYQRIVDRDEYFAGEGGVVGFLDRNNLDVIAIPLGSTSQVATDFAARGGLPLITVPMGFYPPGTEVKRDGRGLVDVAENVPICICFIGRVFSEETLIRIAYAYEQLTQHSAGRKPIRLPSTDLSDILQRKGR